jgi:nicotinate-nucleotide pyrophosphorylase (carboxylating)
VASAEETPVERSAREERADEDEAVLEEIAVSINIEEIVALALREDIGTGDITARALVPRNAKAGARIVARASGTLSGTEVAGTVFRSLDAGVEFSPAIEDGDQFQERDLLATVSGRAAAILGGERVALNFLQQLSGVATMARRFADRIRHTSARIADSRKTVPGLRVLQKKAVVDGGGVNHRFSLADGVLIKRNYIMAAAPDHGTVAAAVARARERSHHLVKVEIEVDSVDEMKAAIEAGADAVMLDNMSVAELTAAVAEARSLVGNRVLLEASGGITLEDVVEIAETGVDIISIGKLTHSAPAIDMALEIP